MTEANYFPPGYFPTTLAPEPVPDLGPRRLVLVTGGQLALLSRLRDYLNTLILHLFVNDHEPEVGDTIPDYEEPSWLSYDPAYLDRWGSVHSTPEGNARIEHPIVRFDLVGSPATADVWGYYVTDRQNRLIWAERRGALPTTISAGGQPYRVHPRLRLREDPA